MKTKESVPRDGRRVALENQALDLSRRCPIDGSNPDNCPLCGLRVLSLPERRAWIRRLKLEELEYLVTYHACCAKEKKSAIVGREKSSGRRPRLSRPLT